MHSNNFNGSRAAWARGFMARVAILLAMELGLMARPAEAAPFAYVANVGSPGSVSVIDTPTNNVVVTIPLGLGPDGVAVTPNGKQAYVTNEFSGTVLVIDTATNTVAATVAVGISPQGVAVIPDGKHAYVANRASNSVSVIDTVTNTVVATIPVGLGPAGVAVTPDGKHSYVANNGSNTVSVIDTVSNTVVATVPVAVFPFGVAVTPDGKHAYVANAPKFGNGTVSVIDTATNTVVATVMVGAVGPLGAETAGVAVTPDGKHAYVTNNVSNNVSVIDTASNTVVATVGVGGGPRDVAVTPDGKRAFVANTPNFGPGTVSVINTASNTVVATVVVGSAPSGVGIVPPPPGIPFSAFSAQLAIHFGGAPNQDTFKVQSSFTLGSASNGIKPLTEAVTLQVGTFTTTIPPGSFEELAGGTKGFGPFLFQGVIDGVALDVLITPTGTKRFALTADAKGANLTGTKNEVQVSLIIGGDSGTTSVKAQISGTPPVIAGISR